MNKSKKNKKRLTCLISLLCFLIIIYIILISYNFYSIKKYDSMILPNTYIQGIDLSKSKYKFAEKIIDTYQENILKKSINLKLNNNNYQVTLKELGVIIDKNKSLQQIKDYQKKLKLSKKLLMISNNMRKDYEFFYTIDENILNNKINELKQVIDVEKQDGYFDTSDGVKYITGHDGYSLIVEENINRIKEKLLNEKNVEEIELVAEITHATYNERYKLIDTLTSSFETPFIPNTYLRNINLNTALRYINGTVLESNETFSFCQKAGPFNKSGYVFYYEFVGNGVCQIATTTYNAALLGGLEIIKRYPHAKKSAYVAGGLDATVASYAGGWCVDMKFRNTYNYPIYIKAYSVNGRARVEFWSNKNAKEGKEYQTESVNIGHNGYQSYLLTYQNKELINRKLIATTWYTEQ